jgi:hypothetical protein
MFSVSVSESFSNFGPLMPHLANIDMSDELGFCQDFAFDALADFDAFEKSDPGSEIPATLGPLEVMGHKPDSDGNLQSLGGGTVHVEALALCSVLI